MEKWQREYIIKNLPYLIENIRCDTILISHLRSLGLLSEPDVATLEAKGISSGVHTKTSSMLDILLTRRKGYEHLTKALFSCKQSGAFVKLLHGMETNISSKSPFELCKIKLDTEQILSKDVNFGGEVVPLRVVLKCVSSERIPKLITGAMDASTYEQFLSEKSIELTVDNIPPPLPYYIPRTLLINRQVDPIIFDKLPDDIFCIEGIELYELSTLSKKYRNASADKSRNQIHCVTAKFILLERHDHFKEIVNNSKKNVHWIKHNKNEFLYVKCITRSGIRSIQSFLLDSKSSQKISEVDFLNDYLNVPRSAPVLLYDSPGMGKSVLLANLARNLKQSNPHINVIHVQFPELISKLRGYTEKHSTVTTSHVLQEIITTNDFGRKIMTSILDSVDSQIDLFLDAFDEIHESDVDMAHSFMDCIINENNNIRMIITTRRHRRDELERKFGVLGYNILPFDDSNKILFFLKFWETEHGVEKSTEIREFAEYCLKTLSFKMSSEEGDIAGIPLQCRMLAEIYAKDAKVGNVYPIDSHVQLNSVFRVYKYYVDTKFAILCSDVERQMCYDFHLRESLRVIFPQVYTLYLDDKCANFVPAYDLIYRIGIIEPSKTDSRRLTFLHHTLAEYFAAEYLATSVTSKFLYQSNLNEFMDLFFEEALMQSCEDLPWAWESVFQTVHVKPFEYPVICQFLDFFLSTMRTIGLDFGPLKNAVRTSKYYNSNRLFQLLASSLLINALDLFSLLLDVYLDLDVFTNKSIRLFGLNDDNIKNTEFSQVKETETFQLYNDLKKDFNFQGLVVTAVQYSSLDLVRLSCELLESVTGLKAHGFPSGEDDNPIYFALQRGHYQIFEYILDLDKEGFYKQPLLHWCLHSSYGKRVGDKVQIVKRILQDRPDLLHKPHRGPFAKVPLLEWRVHFDLMECLIEAGADLTQTAEDKQNIAHLITRYFSADEYHQFVELIVARNTQILFKQRASGGVTPVHAALMCINLKTETLELLAKKCNVNFNDNHPSSGSELAFALVCERSERVINDIIRLGGRRKKLYKWYRLGRWYNFIT